MENKSYEQMEAEFKELYHNKIKPYLENYENFRKQGATKIIMFGIALCSFIIAFILLHFHSYKIIAGIFLCIGVFSFIYLNLLTACDPKNESGATVIETDLEYNLKLVFMEDFLKVFSTSADWYRGEPCDCVDIMEDYRKSNIFNPFPSVIFDDTIYLVYKNIEINIHEVSTATLMVILLIFAGLSLLFAPFLFILIIILSATSFSSFLSFLGIIFVPMFLVLMFYVIRKLIQYAPFKGIVIELKMNKNFKGHTFFLNKSFNSKRIAINRKKYESISLESSSFMKKYYVFSTDQVEARYILTTAMIDRLENLRLAFQANYIRGSFKDNKFILAIGTNNNMFEMGSDFKESNYRAFRSLFNEMISIIKIVDQLKLDENTGL